MPASRITLVGLALSAGATQAVARSTTTRTQGAGHERQPHPRTHGGHRRRRRPCRHRGQGRERPHQAHQGRHAGHHHFIALGLVAEVEGDKVRLSANAAVAVTMEQEDSGRPA